MKKNRTRLGIYIAVALGLLLSAGPCQLYAAGKKPSPPEPQAKSPEPPPAAAEPVDGQNTEKLLYTLNETLQENRRIRQSMRDLQSAFEKVTLEKSDVVDQMKKVEQLAIQRNLEIGRKSKDLGDQLDSSKQEIAKLQVENKVSVENKLALEKKLEAISAENTKMQGLLKSAILIPERDQILQRMKDNEKSVQEAVAQASSLDGENIALKDQLVQSYFALGNMFYDLGRYEDAAVQYLNVLEWDPNYAWAHHNLAVIYDFRLHKIPEAAAHYRKYLHLKSPNEEAEEARMRLWDLTQLSKVTPPWPLKEDFEKYQKMPRS